VYKKFYVELDIPSLLSINYGKETRTTAVNTESKYLSLGSDLFGSPLDNIGVGFRFIF
jgi:hypothetical protein